MSVDTVELTLPPREVGIRSLDDDEVIVIGHLAIGVTSPVKPAAHLTEQGKPRRVVLTVPVD